MRTRNCDHCGRPTHRLLHVPASSAAGTGEDRCSRCQEVLAASERGELLAATTILHTVVGAMRSGGASDEFIRGAVEEAIAANQFPLSLPEVSMPVVQNQRATLVAA